MVSTRVEKHFILRAFHSMFGNNRDFCARSWLKQYLT